MVNDLDYVDIKFPVQKRLFQDWIKEWHLQ